MAKVARPRVVAKQRLAYCDLPAQVTLSLAELARSAKAHLLSLSVALGLATLKELFEEELVRLVGPKGKHHVGRDAYRHGSERRYVTLGGRQVEVERPLSSSRRRSPSTSVTRSTCRRREPSRPRPSARPISRPWASRRSWSGSRTSPRRSSATP